MRKPSKKIIGLILAIVLCFSMLPMSVMAAGEPPTPGIAEQSTEIPSSEAPAPESTPTPEPTPEPTPQPEAEPSGTVTSVMQEKPEQSETPASIEAPEVTKAVSKPFAQVVYHYYNADSTVASTHSYYALPSVNDTSITIAANKYSGKVPVSTEPSRFCILLNGSEDITTQASYDAATGLVSLPADFMDNEITVVWYCPQTDVVEVL